MEYIIGIVAGFIFGWCTFVKTYRNGCLKRTETDDKDVYTLFVDNMQRMNKKRYLLLRIDNARK